MLYPFEHPLEPDKLTYIKYFLSSTSRNNIQKEKNVNQFRSFRFFMPSIY